MRSAVLLVFAFLVIISCKRKVEIDKINKQLDEAYQETYRPQYHFTPPTGWMNDPNGLVYHEGIYHLFYQHYPNATVWGPMHWGHATSEDLVHWKNKPIALFPDEKGFIFSGSAVIDKLNTTGFGKDGKVPLVAIFTYFRLDIEKSGGINTQTQGIAYSLDNGDTWTKYEDNPVIDNTTMKDFRDPKVFWHDPTESWIMTLVAGNHAKFYRSKDLKQWNHISDFGVGQGAHGGVWECPDLFKLKVEGTDEEKWVLIISIGNGSPNGGSGTQYFIGDFDGDNFTSDQIEYKWLDWGTDNYAGVTYNDTPKQDRVFIGWMSNWQYALKTPTSIWRSAMTLPRKLTLRKQNDSYYLANYPVEQVHRLEGKKIGVNNNLKAGEEIVLENEKLNQSVITFTANKNDFELSLSNEINEQVNIIFDSVSNLFMLDRSQSGLTNFNYDFGNKLHYMSVNELPEEFEVKIYIDQSSIEIFLDKGLYAMTSQLFPSEEYSKMTIKNNSKSNLEIKNQTIKSLKSIWK
ncbi:glycoside hydrolase family 32 protein [Croceitalea vernalis]|uniref:Glycoside hydrolase family 32 protein n=1 Tax=Croceitalea vernalis TaxID=3075599 RepID=A0ABU3BC44_9FLAO|nr:glycoside hydrolase family 32 protein [Croceitalea sp. P007]MDT0620047.1 glycoside hydrolase family 32 protein [Croceitalea sp. P007]